MRTRGMYNLANEVTTPQEGYEALAAYTVKKAAEEYREALITGDQMLIDTNERFFRSDRFRIFGGDVDPEYIIERIREEADGYKGTP